jgi:hypothetical protein
MLQIFRKPTQSTSRDVHSTYVSTLIRYRCGATPRSQQQDDAFCQHACISSFSLSTAKRDFVAYLALRKDRPLSRDNLRRPAISKSSTRSSRLDEPYLVGI